MKLYWVFNEFYDASEKSKYSAGVYIDDKKLGFIENLEDENKSQLLSEKLFEEIIYQLEKKDIYVEIDIDKVHFWSDGTFTFTIKGWKKTISFDVYYFAEYSPEKYWDGGVEEGNIMSFEEYIERLIKILS